MTAARGGRTAPRGRGPAGLGTYLEQVADLLRPGTQVLASGLGAVGRSGPPRRVAQARPGGLVALIGSGDAGVYAMGSPALEIADDTIDVIVVPGGDRGAGHRPRCSARRSATTHVMISLYRPAHVVAG